jgi:hypothetical protein
MKTSRRDILKILFGSSYVGLRALATGLPASFLLNPRKALAGGNCPTGQAQYVIFATSGQGDPINPGVPGSYLDPNIVHNSDPTMAATQLTLAGQPYTAALPWSTLPQTVLDRTSFWHIATGTPVHPKEPDVLKLMGAVAPAEMLPSMLSAQLQPCLGSIQSQPVTVGAVTPSEGLSYQGAALPIIPPTALAATLTSPNGPLTDLQPLRDSTLNSLMDIYKNVATTDQRSYIDSWVNTQQQVRSVPQNLMSSLAAINANDITNQVIAAVALIQMNVTPVVAIHIPFGGDNHHDVALQAEATQTVSGVAAINSLMSQLASAGLTDKVSLVSLNVFGRTIGPGNTDGRQHNPNHQVSFCIGRYFKGGVIGGVTPLQGDYGAMDIDSASGKGVANGDVPFGQTLAGYGKTVLAACGVDPTFASNAITGGKIVPAAIAS